LAIAQETVITENPSSYGTTNETVLKKGGFVKSPGNIMYASVSNTSQGYCLVSQNEGSSKGAGYWYMVYDSQSGGFLNNGKLWDFSTGQLPPNSKSCTLDLSTYSMF